MLCYLSKSIPFTVLSLYTCSTNKRVHTQCVRSLKSMKYRLPPTSPTRESNNLRGSQSLRFLPVTTATNACTTRASTAAAPIGSNGVVFLASRCTSSTAAAIYLDSPNRPPPNSLRPI
ncbi:unnamed protein product [Ectocarpus fasciculatus]